MTFLIFVLYIANICIECIKLAFLLFLVKYILFLFEFKSTDIIIQVVFFSTNFSTKSLTIYKTVVDLFLKYKLKATLKSMYVFEKSDFVGLIYDFGGLI